MFARRFVYLWFIAMLLFVLTRDTTHVLGATSVSMDAASVIAFDDQWSAIVNTGNLNMRAGPGSEYAIVSAYPRHTSVVVSGRDQGARWFVVETADGARGWMSARYLRFGFDPFTLPVSSGGQALGSGGQQVTVRENDTRPGPLPVVYYALTEPSGADIYPLGANSYALFAVYDSGTSKVRISQVLPNRITGPNWGLSDTDHLKLYAVEQVNIRLNGLQEIRTDGSIPIGAPGTQNAPQVEVRDIRVKPDRPNVSLIGTSVVNQLVAHIDNTTRIDEAVFTHAPEPVRAPHIELYWPGDSRIPTSDVTLPLEFSGSGVSTDGATAGYLYWIRDVTLRNNGKTVTDAARGLNFLYDTGTTVTIVNDQIAAWLGLSSMQPTFDCLSGRDNGYVIDSVEMTAVDGAYVVEDASICWSDSSIMFASADAVIGSNLFKSVELVLNGPAATLGIIGPAGSVSQGGSSGTDGGASGGSGGYSGVVLDRDSGVAIQGARIIFTREDGALQRETVSAANGAYRIELAPARYTVRAEHEGYATYSTGSGFFVVTGGSFQTGNIFMERQETNSGYSGVVLDRDSGVAIQGARITFTREDGALRRETVSAANGAYRIELPPARYTVRAEHEDYTTYSTGSGFFVVTGGSFQTGNIFMERRTTGDSGGSGESAGCQGTEVGGYCWYLGGDSLSCRDVCAAHGGYDEATRTFAGADGSPDNCRAVIQGVGLAMDAFYETQQGGIGCFVIRLTTGYYGGYWDAQRTTADAVYGTPGRRRLCACTTTNSGASSGANSGTSVADLYDTLMAEVRASTQKNDYAYETELFVRHLTAYLAAHATTDDQAALIDALRGQHDVGDRINALVHRTWKDWKAYGLDHMSADPGQNGQTPLRQLVIRLVQGRHGQLTSTDLRALQNFITRGWDGDIRGLIGAVNRDIYGW